MRVALVIPTLGGGGAERVISYLANGWTARGASVALFTIFDGPDAYPLDPGIQRSSLTDKHWSTSLRPRELLSCIAKLRSNLIKLKPDVVLSFIDESNIYTVLACAGLSLPVVVASRSDPESVPHRRVLRLMRRILFPRAKVLVTQTAESATWFRSRAYGLPIRVIPNPVDIEALEGSRTPPWTWPASERSRVVLSVGRLTAEKGHAALVDAFARVAEAHTSARLVLVGDGSERQRLEAQVRTLGLSSRVSFVGWKRNVADYFGHSDIFVLPSRYEGFPNVLVEAMASGLACIATACRSGPAEIISSGRDGLLVPVDDVPAMAAALDLLLRDDARRRALGSAAREVRTRYSPESVLSAWADVLELARSMSQPRAS